MSTDVQFLLLGFVAFIFAYIATEKEKKSKLARREKDMRPGFGVSFAGVASSIIILVSLAHIIVRLIAGS